MEYIIVLVVLLIGAVFFDGKPESKSKRTWLYFEWLLLVLLAGLRYKVGGDTLIYQDIYEGSLSAFDIIDSSKTENWNILWKLFMALCRFVSSDFAFFQTVHAIIVNSVFFWFFKRKTNNYFLAVLLYFVFFYFRYNTETMKAALSVCCFLLSYDYLVHKKYLKYYFGVVVALGFHSESIFMILFPIVHAFGKFKPSVKSISILLLFAVIGLSVNLLPLFQKFSIILGNMSETSQAMSGNMAEKIAIYSGGSKLGAGVSFLGYIHAFLSNFTWIYLIILLRINRQKAGLTMAIQSDRNILIGFLILHFLLGILHINYHNIFFRFQDFTNIIVLVSLCQSFQILSKSRYTLHKFLLSLFMTILIVERILYFASGALILFYPYSSVFNPVEYPEREFYVLSEQAGD